MRIPTGKQLRIAAISDCLCFLLKIVQRLPIVFRGSCPFLAWNSTSFSFHPLAGVQPPLSWLPTPFCSSLRTSRIHWSSWCTLCSHTSLPLDPVLSSSTANSYSCVIQQLLFLLSQAFFGPSQSRKRPCNALSLWHLAFSRGYGEFLWIPRPEKKCLALNKLPMNQMLKR